MSPELTFGLLISIFFLSISIHNFKIRKECVYFIQLTKPRKVLFIFISILFSFVAYMGGNEPQYYILALSAAFCLNSTLVCAGIHEKGIYYYPTRRLIATLVKWESIENVRVNKKKNQLKSFRHTKYKRRIYPNQYYLKEAIEILQQFD